MDAGRQVAQRESPVNRQRKLLDNVAGSRSDDVRSQHPPVSLVDDFDEAVQILFGDSSVNVVKLPPTYVDLVAIGELLASIRFRQPTLRDFRGQCKQPTGCARMPVLEPGKRITAVAACTRRTA